VSKKDDVWGRTPTARGKNPDVWRRDEMGNLIRYGSYRTSGEYGWKINRRNPVSKGGTENPRNLRALHTTSNRHKSDKY
jgi:hypothetical protein